MSAKRTQRTKTMAQRHSGIITKIARRYWWLLYRVNPHATTFISIEDLISEAVMHVVGSGHRYQRKRGAESTFVWRIASNRCQEVVARQTYQKRFAIMLPETSLSLQQKPDGNICFLEERISVERFLQFASDELQQYMWDFLETRRYRPMTDSLIAEARKLACDHGVTRSDFRSVFQTL